MHALLLILLAIWTGGICTTGCTSYYAKFKGKTDQLYENPFAKKDPRKKIRLDFITAPSLEDTPQLTALFEQTVLDRIQNDSRNLLIYEEETNPNVSIFELKSNAHLKADQQLVPDSSRIDPFNLAQKARQQGLNTIIRTGITHIDTQDRLEGLLSFKKNRHYLQIHCSAEGYNTVTGAKIFDESLVHEMKIDKDKMDGESIQNGQWQNLPEIAKAVEKIACRLSEKMLDALKYQQWTSFITAVTEKQVEIAAGNNVGLQPGDVFDVHGIGDIKKGLNGHRYQGLGLKTGEVRITTVASEHATGAIISGTVTGPGSTIKHRH
jgi:hypothetical protein